MLDPTKIIRAAILTARRLPDPRVSSRQEPRLDERVDVGFAAGGDVEPPAAAAPAPAMPAPTEEETVNLAKQTLAAEKPKRASVAIAPGVGKKALDEPVETPKNDPSKVNMMSLATAFDKAIKHHLSLPREQRIMNSQLAVKALEPYVGKRKDGKPIPLLGKNAKLMKSEAGYKGEEPVTLPDGRGIETTGIALSPAFQMGKFNTCPNHAACKDECLGKTSGNYFKVGGGMDLSAFKGPRLNSLNKTLAMVNNPEAFAVRLHDEISSAKREAESNGNHLGVRLNVLSDLHPRIHKSIIESHPDVSFYDYTKNNTDPIAPNHHYTYSSTGFSHDGVNNPNTNWKQMRRRLDSGYNVAMAFTDKEHLPEEVHDEETGKKYRVVNGDSHDFRPLDIVPEGEDGVIVGLKNKKGFGSVDQAHKESKGFFVKYDPGRIKNNQGTYVRGESQGVGPSGKPKLGPTVATNRTVRIPAQNKTMQTKDNDGNISGGDDGKVY